MCDEKINWSEVLENITPRFQELPQLLIGKREEEARRKRALYDPPRANLLHPPKWPADTE